MAETSREYLERHGWRFVAKRHVSHGSEAHLWHHPDHQHATRGYFLQGEAEKHQRGLDKGKWCSCIPRSAHGPVRIVRSGGEHGPAR